LPIKETQESVKIQEKQPSVLFVIIYHIDSPSPIDYLHAKKAKDFPSSPVQRSTTAHLT